MKHTLTQTVKKLHKTLFKLLNTKSSREKKQTDEEELCSHATGVVKCLKGPKVPPCWRKSVLQETTTALTGRLEEFNVAPQPGLQRDTEV